MKLNVWLPRRVDDTSLQAERTTQKHFPKPTVIIIIDGKENLLENNYYDKSTLIPSGYDYLIFRSCQNTSFLILDTFKNLLVARFTIKKAGR